MQTAQHRRAVAFVVLCHVGIQTVGGAEILAQVIRANAGKIHLCGNEIGDLRDRRDLDHDAQRDIAVVGDALRVQICHHTAGNGSGAAKIRQ